MMKFYATFGLGHEHQDKIQPIYAPDATEARNVMLKVYQDKWAFLYTEKQFIESKAEGHFKNHEELPTLYAHVDMTVGEMFYYTMRLRQILHGSELMRDVRIAELMSDLEKAYHIPMLNDENFNKRNPFVIQLYRTASELRSFEEVNKE